MTTYKDNGTSIQRLSDGASIPEEWKLLPASATLPPDIPTPDELEATRIAAIKSAAGSIIFGRYPQWKQSNLTARMLELVNKKLSTPLTPSEMVEEVAITAAWAWVKSARAQSDVAEATPGLLAGQVVWPQ